MKFPTANPNRVLFQATCERLSPSDWEVTVEGQDPHAHTRTYLKSARSDDEAVQQSVVEFINEMETLETAQ